MKKTIFACILLMAAFTSCSNSNEQSEKQESFEFDVRSTDGYVTERPVNPDSTILRFVDYRDVLSNPGNYTKEEVEMAKAMQEMFEHIDTISI